MVRRLGVILRPIHPEELEPKREGWYVGYVLDERLVDGPAFAGGLQGAFNQVVRQLESLRKPPKQTPTQKEFWQMVKRMAESELKRLKKVVPLKPPKK